MKREAKHAAGKSREASEPPVAIVGFSGVFPGGRSLADFWSNIERGVDTSRPVPSGRWVLDPLSISGPGPIAPDRVYTDRGCFIEGFQLDPEGLHLPDGWIQELDPSFHLLLEAGRGALAGTRGTRADGRRTGIVLGNIALPTTASSTLGRRVLEPLLQPGIEAGTLPPADAEARALNRYVAGMPAGVLALALGLGGGTSTVDAACASSLYALKLACDELIAGRADAMLAGGLSRPDSLYTQMGFCQLRALSRTGRCAPFDADGSGLIVGEGAGVLVLKRLADAIEAGDEIHAVIRGIGLSNDLDGNLLSPDSEGQLRALHQAYRQAGWSPEQVDLIECHATGTPVGDAVEFGSLLKLWQGGTWQAGQCVLGAVKANVGHLLTAAGSASLIKVLLALRHQTLPPTANFRRAADKIPLADSPFRVLQQSEPWNRREAQTPRRAAVNGFGFGGVNAHVLIEEWMGQAAPRRPKTRRPGAPAPIAIIGMGASVGSWTDLPSFQERVLGGGREQPPAERSHWRGVPKEELRRLFGVDPAFPGHYCEDVEIPVNRYRIPPKELEELLPQQALMLDAARSALLDAGAPGADPARTGVMIGLGLDLRTTDFHLRWQTLGDAERPLQPLPLTADRTMGALAGIVASRIAKEFHFGGASFTICSEDCSGVRALETAVRALQNGELDRAVAGAVDLTGDLRSLWATDALQPYSRRGCAQPFDTHADGPVPGEGSVALVLKRLEDAQRDGDRIYAVIRGIGAAGGGEIGGRSSSPQGDQLAWRESKYAAAYQRALESAYGEARIDPAAIGYIEANGLGHPGEDETEVAILDAFFASRHRRSRCHLGSAKADVGHAGAASGLISVVKASLALFQEVIPPLRGMQQPLASLARSRTLSAPVSAQYWVRDRAHGPRRAGVSTASVDGNVSHVVLEAFEDPAGDRWEAQRTRPLGAWPEVLLVLAGADPDELLGRLIPLQQAAAARQEPVEALARAAWNRASLSGSGVSLALVVRDHDQLARLLGAAVHCVERNLASPPQGLVAAQDRDRLFYRPPGQRMGGDLAFVFPGAGNCFPDMGRELAARWPGVLRAQDRENEWLASQMFAERFWNAAPDISLGTDHRAVICGQVTLGTLVSDLAFQFGLRPAAVVGYSLGESTGLFALRAWTDRDEMLRRVTHSTLFTKDLTGTSEALRRAWGLPDHQTVHWQAGLVDRPAAEVGAAMASGERLYVLIVNTPGECVIGGEASAVKALVNRLGCHWFPLNGVSTVHCDLLRPVEQPYRELHLFPTSPPAGVRFFSGGWGRAYTPDRETAADAIVAQASDRLDFPRVVLAAYEAGIRFFLEIGPGNSCSRMIGRILDGRPHLARSLCASAQEPVSGLLRVLGQLAAEGLPVDLHPLFPQSPSAMSPPERRSDPGVLRIRIPITGPSLAPPKSSPQAPIVAAGARGVEKGPASASAPGSAQVNREPTPPVLEGAAVDPFEGELFQAMARSRAAALEAHEAYLAFSQRVAQALSRAVEEQFRVLSALSGTPAEAGAQRTFTISGSAEAPRTEAPPQLPDRRVRLDRTACLEFARGSVATVLGPDFAAADHFPTRVRLPDEPLMLVDRILCIEGEPLSLSHGRVVTEHDILPGAWYLDGGRIPTCIAVEAGQADLFLSGYLGIDFITQGRAVYRLLDAKVCFHQGLPGPGAVIHYDIRIDRFFQQSDTWLFRFRFEATVDGQPFLTMTDGCAGFFTEAELAGGKGVVRTTIDLKPAPGKRPADWTDFVAWGVESYSDAQLEALRAGDLAGCFGAQFARLPLVRPMTLPSGRMKLVHRIPLLDPVGGRFGLGLVRGEADIHADDWFLTCHFVDDRVMPGTLMFECCLHTLRVFLLRMGWVVEEGQAVLEPIPGVVSQLKCRGQVLETTARVTYEISVKELGYAPEPYVIADALMYADGKPIVDITNMSLRYSGVTREALETTWAIPASRPGDSTDEGVRGAGSSGASPHLTFPDAAGGASVLASRPGPPTDAPPDKCIRGAGSSGTSTHPKDLVSSRGTDRKAAIYDVERILAFAVGNPSDAFGAPYRVFDKDRRIARLPGPPYQFLDRITEVEGEPFKLVAGGVAEAQYDVPPDAWYFAEHRQGDMPFAVLLEIALQPCGWLAAYLGSALTSETDLSFRNLGGQGTQFVRVLPAIGTLTTRVKMTRVSSSAGMILQWFDFEVRAGVEVVYRGDTYFGFFPAAALARQEGIQGAARYLPAADELARGRSLDYPTEPPFPGEPLRMVDRIEVFVPDGGPHQLGYIRASRQVLRDEWFFKAHFYQDPVVPGSLGLESFLQLLKFVASERWGSPGAQGWQAVALDAPHEWVYRGQVIPENHRVTIEAVVTAVDDAARLLTADGFLSVDGRVIYGMKRFTVQPAPGL
jgi:acyl transferase domain-containing protein/3-hydroxymyristoyl/3-hydroxydecanoyl-(acyl carrier protein) dehydratase